MRWLKWILGGAAVGVGTALLSGGSSSSSGRDRGAPDPGDGKPWSGPCVPCLPCGKGLFVRHVSHGGDADLFAKRMQYMGIRWALVQSMFHESKKVNHVNDSRPYAEYAAAMREVDCTPWVWGWPRPEPDAILKFRDVTMLAVERLNAPGVVINVEAPWHGKREASERLLTVMRQALGSRLLGVTTYGGGPGWIENFPFDAFADCDFTIPQFYDVHDRLGARFSVKATQRYLKKGFKNIIPALAAYSISVPRMAEMVQRVPFPCGAACWWTLDHALASAAKVEFIRNVQIPPPGTLA